MAGFSNISGDESIMFANNASFDGTERGGKMTTNGQLWIGATASPHVRLGSLASADSSVTITTGAGTIDLKVAGGGTSVITLTGDVGGSVAPTAGNINLIGYKTSINTQVMDTHKTGVSTMSIEDRTWTTQFVVDPSATVGDRGTFATIQTAITAASSGDSVFIRPGTYTEDLTLKSGVNLIAYNSFSVTNTKPVLIRGKCSLSSGEVHCTGISFRTNVDFAFDLTGSGIVSLTDCCLLAFNNTAVQGVAGTQMWFYNCQGIGSSNQPFFNTAGAINIINSYFLGSVTGTSTITSTGSIEFWNSSFQSPLSITGANANFNAYNTQFGGPAWTTTTLFTYNSTLASAGNYAYNCSFESISQVAVTIGASATLKLCNCVINSTNTNAISGAGTLKYSNLSFVGSSSNISTTTQVPLIASNDAKLVTTPGAYPYTTIPQDNLILVDTSSARTITPLASPTTGQVHRIKDNVGSAAANNITITPSGKNIDGAASYTINVNYGSVDIIFNGTQWNLI